MAAVLALLVALAVVPLSPSAEKACVFGTPTEVHELLSHDSSFLSQVDRNGRTPLALAAAFNPDPEVATLLIHAGADLEARDRHGWTPLILAARYNSSPVVEALWHAGADPRVRDLKHRSAADAASRNPLIADTSLYWRLYRAQYGGRP